MLDRSSSRNPRATLSVAVAVSVAVHVSTFVVLVGVDGGPRAWMRDVAVAPTPVLEARLVALGEARAARRADGFRNRSGALAAGAADRALARGWHARPRPLLQRGPANAARSAGKPHVIVNDRVPRARFGEALEGDALAAFLTEVDAGVVLPERFDVPYPQAALAARKEGAVLVWAVIDDQGKVDDVHVVDGDAEFAEAVDAALRATRFGPARNLGQNVPFYVTLEFEFRIDAVGGTVAAERARR